MSEIIRKDIYNLGELVKTEGWKLVYNELVLRIERAQQRLERCGPDELSGLQAQIKEDRFLLKFPETRKFGLEEAGGGINAQDSES